MALPTPATHACSLLPSAAAARHPTTCLVQGDSPHLLALLLLLLCSAADGSELGSRSLQPAADAGRRRAPSVAEQATAPMHALHWMQEHASRRTLSLPLFNPSQELAISSRGGEGSLAYWRALQRRSLPAAADTLALPAACAAAGASEETDAGSPSCAARTHTMCTRRHGTA